MVPKVTSILMASEWPIFGVNAHIAANVKKMTPKTEILKPFLIHNLRFFLAK